MASSHPHQNGVNGTTQISSQAPSNATATPSGPSLPASNPTTDARPRDARLIELLLTAQGVTAYEQRVPLLLLDFAYRHTSSILSDALHLAGDPNVTQAGARPAASAGATAMAPGEAPVTANAVKLAISARLSYQFRGGSSGGGISKEYMLEMARERNKVALPKISPNEWGVRLPNERFVLSGTSWGLKDVWEGEDEEEEANQEVLEPAGEDAMQGVEGPDLEEIGEEEEGGTVDVFGVDADQEMAEDE